MAEMNCNCKGCKSRATQAEVEVEADWELGWRDLLEDNDGSIRRQQLKMELHDYSALMKSVAQVYEELSGGKISHPFTPSRAVIQAARSNFECECDESAPMPGDKVMARGIVFVENGEFSPVRSEPAELYKLEATAGGKIRARIGWKDGEIREVPYESLEKTNG